MTEEDITVLKHMISEREDLLKKAPTKLLVRGDFIDKALTLLNAYGIKIDSEESTKPFNLEGITKLANDMLVQNTVLRKKLGEVENQRDELLEALELADDDIQYYGNSDFNKTLIEIRVAIAKAKGE
jgi:hypothetical protein